MSEWDKNYIKVPVIYNKSALFHFDIYGKDYFNYVFIHKDMRHYLIKEGAGHLLGVSTNSRAYDGPKGWVKIYVNKDQLCRTIKATKLAKKMYPDAIEQDGNLIILKKGFEVG
jgi:hypothetical protein